VALPGEPSVQRIVTGGGATTKVVDLGHGDNRSYTVSENQEPLQSIYMLEIERADHDCRHVQAFGGDGGVGCE
jgi:hypothetical protein